MPVSPTSFQATDGICSGSDEYARDQKLTWPLLLRAAELPHTSSA